MRLSHALRRYGTGSNMPSDGITILLTRHRLPRVTGCMQTAWRTGSGSGNSPRSRREPDCPQAGTEASVRHRAPDLEHAMRSSRWPVHPPRGAGEWNRIEPRLLAIIPQSWRAVPPRVVWTWPERVVSRVVMAARARQRVQRELLNDRTRLVARLPDVASARHQRVPLEPGSRSSRVCTAASGPTRPEPGRGRPSRPAWSRR